MDLLARSLALDYERGGDLGRHHHPDWAQLIHAAAGVMTVDTGDGSWVVPPQRMVWVPAGITHSLRSAGALKLRTIYVRAIGCGSLPGTCSVMSVTPLLRELILTVVSRGTLDASVPRDRRLLDVLLDELGDMRPDPLELPMPRDPRAVRVAERLRANPAEPATLADICAGAGGSKRTVERLFLRETGISLGQWRRRARLMHALRLLAGGASVTEVAYDVGYESLSAFVTMFRKTLGTTPGRYSTSARGA